MLATWTQTWILMFFAGTDGGEWENIPTIPSILLATSSLVTRYSEFSTSLTPSSMGANIYPSMDTHPTDIISCLQRHDINTLLVPLFWKHYRRSQRTGSIKRQHVDVVIFGENRHLTHHPIDDNCDFKVVNRGVMFFIDDGLVLSYYLSQLWGVMLIVSDRGDLVVSHRLLQLLAQHVRYVDQLVPEIHVAWGDILQLAFALMQRMEILATPSSQDKSSTIIARKFQKIDRCIMLAHGYHTYDHTSNKNVAATLLYLEISIVDCSVLIGDNKTVVGSTTQPHSRLALAKRHLMLSYHFVREAIASGNYALLFVWLNVNVFLRSDGNCGIFSHHISRRDDIIINNIHRVDIKALLLLRSLGRHQLVDFITSFVCGEILPSTNLTSCLLYLVLTMKKILIRLNSEMRTS
mmetsp:Transcript_22574/g.38481  ORF Transcript_22574/g.38481 Transcript_22574/m.38481 type:complete len:407 (-) Transcript_22574:530-1750(-)